MNHQDTKAKDFQIKFGNLPTKLAFNYNYGMTNVDRHLEKYGTLNISELPSETQGYIKKIRRLVEDKKMSLTDAQIQVESANRPDVISNKGAVGLMQILPSTAAFIMKNRNYRGKLRHDLLIPEKNILIGEKYIQHLSKEPIIDNDIIKLLAAYNGGPGNLNKWLKNVNFNKDPLLLIETIPSRETRNYIKEVLKNYYVYNNKFLYNGNNFEELASGKWIIK